MTILLDTNVVLEHLRSGCLLQTPDDVGFAVSVITVAELLRLSGIGAKEIRVIEDFLGFVSIVNIDAVIARKAAALGRTRKTKLPDLLIAATAIELEAPLITRNVKDYKGIVGLQIQDSV